MAQDQISQIEFSEWGIKKIPKGHPTGIDLFAGAGGFSCGMQMGGLEVVGAVEIDKDACETLRANRDKFFPNMTVIDVDIRHLNGKELLKRCGVNELDVLYGGPPCQGFSTSNQLTRGLDDPRSRLMFEFLRMVKEIKPKIFMIENVPGLFQFKDFFIMLLEQLENIGYVVRFNMLNCVGYGVPQRRIRMLIHGDRKDLKRIPTWPVYTHSSEPKYRNGKKKVLMIPVGSVMEELFPINGFGKEQVNHLRYNRTLDFFMDRRTEAQELDHAINRCIFKSINNHLEIEKEGIKK